MKVVLSTAPLESAKTLASKLVEARLAACVNVVPEVLSVYRWEGAVQQDEEALLVIKTSDERLQELTKTLARMHPYDVPEIVALEVPHASALYAAWVDRESTPVNSD